MSAHKISFQKNTVLMALLGCTALSFPMGADAAVSAKTSWAVSRVASQSMGSYCTMAQKYADDTVLTLAQNTKGEYSLALDFKEKSFTAGKKQSVALSVDGGKTKSYDVMPQNDKTAVIGIGKDADLINKIASSEKLSVKVNSETSDFELSEFANGQKELTVCMEALKAPAPEAAPKSVAAKKAPAEMNAVATSSGADNNEPSVEGLLAAAPKSSSEITVQADDDFIPVVPAKPKVGGKVEKADNSGVEIAALREENARLSRALADQRKSFEQKQSAVDGAAVSEMREKLEAARVENDTLRAEVEKLNAKPAPVAAPVKDNAKESAQAAQLNETVKALQQENQTLKNQIQIYASSKGKVDATADANAASLAKLQTENADLKQVIAGLKAAKADVATTSAASNDDEVNKLRAENRKISHDLELAQTENADLQKRTASMQKDMEGKQLKMAGGSWDLEQATRRYQESQREIVRLGSLLQSQDVKCANEKKDIEYMLFDPAIATKAQISMLNSMEDQIKEKDEQLKKAEGGPEKDAKIAQLEKEVADTKAQLVSESQQLADAHSKLQESGVAKANAEEQSKNLAALKANAEEQGKSIVAMKAELAQKSKELADAQSKAQGAQVAQADIDGKNKILLDMQNTLATKNQQLAEAQAKLQQASNAQLASTTQKDSEVQTLKAQLSQAQSLLAAEQIKSSQVNTQAQAQQSAESAATIAGLQLQVQQANQKVIQLQNQISESNSAALRAASISPAAAPAAYQPVANPVTNASYTAPVVAKAAPVAFKSMDEFSALLKNAGVNVRGALQQVKGGDPASYRAYSWKTDSLYGSVEMKKVSDESQFESTVSQYLTRAKSRCAGEFAAVPSPVKAAGMAKSEAYEIACVGQSSSSSASVLFTYGNQIATTVAHEGRAEAMDLAIDARDRVSSKMN